MQIDTAFFADPAMRPHLEKYYEQKKADFAQALADREARPESVTLPDGGTAKALELTPDMLVPFDKWLELMQDTNLFSGARNIEQARDNLAMLEHMNNPDSPADVATVFSDGDRILAWLNGDGTMALRAGADFLQPGIGKDEMARRLSVLYPDLQITEYDAASQPTKREFAARWYPGHDVDANYEEALREARAHLQSMESWAANIKKNHDAMRAFLLESMQAA